MRSQLFRTDPVLLVGPYAGTPTIVCLKDIDGIVPFTLYVENMDLKAALIMRTGGAFVPDAPEDEIAYATHGSKNGCLKFEAVTAGAVGNTNTIEITAASDQVFSVVALVYDGWKINLKCDHSGKPIQTAYEVLIAIAAATGDGAAFRAAVNTTLAPGSDGSATMELAAGSTTHVLATAALQGGADAADAGAAIVEHSPSIDGPWDTSAAASSAFSGLLANTVAAFEITMPLRGVRITIERDAEDTRIVCTAIAGRKL